MPRKIDTSFIEDLPSGPLDHYRKQASFNWKDLKIIFEEEDLYKLKLNVWNTLENDPIFRRPEVEPTTEEMKRQTALQLNQYCKYSFLPPNILSLPYKPRTRLIMTLNESIAACFPDVSIKHALGVGLFTNAILSLGTERHDMVFKASFNKKILGCIALTEVAHGSDTKQMRTTATYVKETKEFVINTPDFESAKCWVGNLGKTSTVALLFAQLYTDGQCHGLHGFVVPIRDPRTLLPYPGIIVGDIGEKAGLNGIDNGFMLFQDYRIPRENLLNRSADVTADGDYESKFSDPGKILGAALENLSTGRVGIMQECTNNLICAITISIRYAAVRKQFGTNGRDTEITIIEYQLHQWRLFPYVATGAVLKLFVMEVTEDYLKAVEFSSTSNNGIENLTDMVSEIHAIISAAKPLITWACISAIQESREACGGHGYLKASRLGELRNNNDPCVTYEGDNNVLVQQTSNWLLRQWKSVVDSNTVSSPLGTCSFLLDHKNILAKTFGGRIVEDVIHVDFIKEAYEWLLTYLVSATHNSQQEFLSNGETRFSARNNTQVYKAAVLSKAYGEYIALRCYWRRSATANLNEKIVLQKLGILYGLTSLDKHLVYFYQGKYASGPNLVDFVRDAILSLCATLKPDIVAVVDALAPPDYIVNSVLGKSDGKLYQHLQREFFGNPGAMSRPQWWHEIIIKDAPNFKLSAKL